MSDFTTTWKRHYGNSPPIGHVLRQAHRWIRFYALPEAKRYATTPEEHAEILQRAHAIANMLFEPDEDIWRVHCVYVGAESDTPDARAATALPFIDEVVDPMSEVRFRVHAIRERWEPTKHNALLQDIADDVVAHVLFFGTKGLSILAPYDGGFDVMFASDKAYEALRSFEPTWSR